MLHEQLWVVGFSGAAYQSGSALVDEMTTARLRTYLYTKGIQMVSIVCLICRRRMQT